MITVSKSKPLTVSSGGTNAAAAAAVRINAALAHQKPANAVVLKKPPGSYENVFLSFISRQQGNDKKPKNKLEISVKKQTVQKKWAETVVTGNKNDLTQNINDVTQNINDVTQNKNDITQNKSDITQNKNDVTQNANVAQGSNDVKNKVETVAADVSENKDSVNNDSVLEALIKLRKLDTTVMSLQNAEKTEQKERKPRKSDNPKNISQLGHVRDLPDVRNNPNVNIISSHTIQPKSGNQLSPMPVLSKPENVPYTKHDTMPSLDPVQEVSQAKYVFRQQLQHEDIYSIDNSASNNNSQGNDDVAQYDKSTTTEDDYNSEDVENNPVETQNNEHDRIPYVNNDVGAVNNDVTYVNNNLSLVGNGNIVTNQLGIVDNAVNVVNSQINANNVVNVINNPISILEDAVNLVNSQITPSNAVNVINNQLGIIDNNVNAPTTVFSVVNVPYNVVNTIQTQTTYVHESQKVYGINNVYNVGVAPSQSLNVYTVQTNVVNGPTTLLQPVQPTVVEPAPVEVVKKVRKPNLIWSNQNFYRVNRCETEYKNNDRFYPMSMQPIVLPEDKLKTKDKPVKALEAEKKVIVECLPELNVDSGDLPDSLHENVCSNDDSNQENVSDNVKINEKSCKLQKCTKKSSYSLNEIESYPKIYEQIIKKLENEISVCKDDKVLCEKSKQIQENAKKEPLNVLEKFETFQEKFKESSVSEYVSQNYVYSPKLGYVDKTMLPEVADKPAPENRQNLKKKKFMKTIKMKKVRNALKFLSGRRCKNSKDGLTPKLRRQIRQLTPLQARVCLDDVMAVLSPKSRRKLLNMDSCVIPHSRLPFDAGDREKTDWKCSGKDRDTLKKVRLSFYFNFVQFVFVKVFYHF